MLHLRYQTLPRQFSAHLIMTQPLRHSPRIVVLGIGNTLLQDEGAGVHAMRHLQNALPDASDIEFIDGGTLSFSLAGAIGEAECLLVFDAAELGEAPGTIRIFCNAEMDCFIGSHRKRSVHEVGLLDLLAIAHLTDSLPTRRALIGIQADVIGWGEAPSPAVLKALPKASARAQEVIHGWRHPDTSLMTGSVSASAPTCPSPVYAGRADELARRS